MPDPRRLLLIALCASILAGFSPASGIAQEIGSHARIVRISFVEGTVQFNGEPAIINTPVTEGSRIVTGPDGLAEIQFEDATTVRLASETDITFAQLARLSTGEALTRVDFDDGEGEFLIPASSAGRFAVNAHGKNILFKQPGRFRILSVNSSPLEIAVWKGEAGVRDRETGVEVSVKNHETFTLNPDDPEQYTLESSVLGDDLDRWSEQRDQDLNGNYVSTYTSASNSAFQSSAFVPAYYAPCPYSWSPYGCWDPFLFAGGYCWNCFPWFFPPGPRFVVITPPLRPRRPGPIRPPTIPVVAKVGTPVGTVKPEVHNFHDAVEGRRLFNDETFRRSVPTGAKVTESTNTSTQPVEAGVAPGHHSGNSASTSAATQPNPPSQTAHTHHSSPAPVSSSNHSSYSGSHGSSGTSHSSSSGSHGFSGGGSHSSGGGSHSSGSSSHSGGHR